MKNLGIIGVLFIIGCSSSTSISGGEGGDPSVVGGSGGEVIVAGSAGVENVSGGTDTGGAAGTGGATGGSPTTGGVVSGGAGGVVVVPVEICGDYIDNDLDGDVDCNDPDCKGTEFCPEPVVDNCCNDNLYCSNMQLTACVQDYLLSCNNPDFNRVWDYSCIEVAIEFCGAPCQNPEYGASECSDGIDNDGDGLSDINDVGCK